MNDNDTREIPFKSYEGSDDYTYITYSKKDSKKAYPDLIMFNDLGLNVFYNEGLEKPKKSIESLEEHIKDSTLFVPILTESVIRSELACKEIFMAALHQIPIISVYLEEMQLNDALEFALRGKSDILQYEMDDTEFNNRFSNELERIQSEIKGNQTSKMMYVSELFEGRRQESMKIDPRKATIPIESSQPFSRLWGKVKSKFLGGEPADTTHFEGHEREVGDHTYLCYSNADISAVSEDLAIFNEKGIKVKDPSTENLNIDAIASAIETSREFIFYLSKNTLKSEYAKQELIFAFEKNVPIITVWLEDVDLKDKHLKFFLKSSQHVLRYEQDGKNYDYRDAGTSLEESPDNASEDYIYISFIHADIKDVFEDLAMFDKMGIEVRHNFTAAHAGTDYTNTVESLIQNAKALIVYVSEKSLQNSYVNEELIYAYLNKIPIILVHLDNVITITSTVKHIIDGKPEIFKYDLDRKDYESAIMEHLRL